MPSKKGTGFVQPLKPHEHWHVDVCYLNVASTFYFPCSVLDGCSRFIVHHEIREIMEEKDVETIIQRARESWPGERPRVISDNGQQFLAKEFKEFIRIAGMTHVKTSPYYPQPNGKIERWHNTLKSDCIREKVHFSLSLSLSLSLSMTPVASSAITPRTTTRSACTALSAPSRPTTQHHHRRTRPQARRGRRRS